MRAALLVLSLLLLAAGCSGPDVQVSTLGTTSASFIQATPSLLADLLDVSAEVGPVLDDSAWPRCTTKNGSHALLAHRDAVRKALAPSEVDHRVLVTDMPIAIDRPGAPCTRVFGAAPPDTGVVLVSARELRGRCSSMSVADAVARVAAHELGHALDLVPAEARCDARGCHCTDRACLMSDERGGCPQLNVTLCPRCAAR